MREDRLWMEYRIATECDIEQVLALHAKYHVDTIADEDRKDGFVTTALTHELLLELIKQEDGLVVADDEGVLAGYLMSASWGYCSKWPLFQYMISRLGELEFNGMTLSETNSYQYGPVCIDTAYRGTGVLQELLSCSLSVMKERYPILVTFVNKLNPRSMKAHQSKLRFLPLLDFEFQGKDFTLLVYDTSTPVV